MDETSGFQRSTTTVPRYPIIPDALTRRPTPASECGAAPSGRTGGRPHPGNRGLRACLRAGAVRGALAAARLAPGAGAGDGTPGRGPGYAGRRAAGRAPVRASRGRPSM
jgi:hypothetical protein